MSAGGVPAGGAAAWSVDEAERHRRRTALARVRARRNLPTTETTLETTVEIGAPAAAVWAVLTDPARAAEVLEYPPLVACTAPWTPDGAVGELSCVAMRMPDGTVRTGIEEALLRDEGRRLVSRTRTGPFPSSADWTLVPVGPNRCQARVVSTMQTFRDGSSFVRRAYRAGTDAALWRLRRAVGDPAVAAEPEPRLTWLERYGRGREASKAARLAAGSRVPVEAVRVLHLPVPAEQLWASVRATGSPVVEHGDPLATCFTPDGGPPDAVGALRLVVGRAPLGDLELQVEEVAGLVPGAGLATRSLAAFGPTSQVNLVATGHGCTVEVRLVQECAPRRAAATGLTLARRAEAYLDRLGRATTGMPPLPLEEAWVG